PAPGGAHSTAAPSRCRASTSRGIAASIGRGAFIASARTDRTHVRLVPPPHVASVRRAALGRWPRVAAHEGAGLRLPDLLVLVDAVDARGHPLHGRPGPGHEEALALPRALGEVDAEAVAVALEDVRIGADGRKLRQRRGELLAGGQGIEGGELAEGPELALAVSVLVDVGLEIGRAHV